ncbi:P-loop containing nucleoside triphosphate hydrolase protein [Armillaria solidipes]|uniref:P-loop containing nucleoside triphosphate hydrolase protein n=1 Tax=Armillaria solidipes TaxID=1076256 RepID=A0A2H3BKN1_9AGAR|nr:P-loop containing nucleoside triphosphate hydrolase protein [Armillaria solidipes]
MVEETMFIGFATHLENKWITDSLIIPFYASIASVLILLIQGVKGFLRQVEDTKDGPVDTDEEPAEIDPAVRATDYLQQFKDHVSQSGGTKIFTYRVLRLVGCLGLLGLSIAILVLDIEESYISDIRDKAQKKRPYSDTWLKPKEWLTTSLCLTFLYTFLLAVISVTAHKRWSRVAIRHLNTILTITASIYVYRDIAPLATFTGVPLDASEGCILWTKIAVLLFTGIVIPLVVPREYIPVDPDRPVSTPNPEQTARIISLILYFWLDPVVKAAYHVAHLRYDQLPPLADYDASKYLKARSFKYVDVFAGAKKRHLFWGIMRVFTWDYIALVLVLVIQLCAEFAAPIGINRLLHYIETGSKDSQYRPWLWIAWLFIGPLITSISSDWYIFISTRCLVRAEGIITQLVFEHALRIRAKAETDNPASGKFQPRDLIDTPEEASEDLQNPAEAKLGQYSEGKNLIGRINNLVTTDLKNITDARGFVQLLVYTPPQLILCVVFLYVILGWSAFVGLAIIILMLPAPGFLAKLTQDVQAAALEKTDGRVQAITEIVNVLRMIKLFGWERKMEERIARKRDEELLWIRRKQLLNLLSGIIKFSFLRAFPYTRLNDDGNLCDLCTFNLLLDIYRKPLIPRQTIIMKQQLSSATVFSSMTIFEMFSSQQRRLLSIISMSTAGKVSLNRLTDFMHNTEVLDSYSQKDDVTAIMQIERPMHVIGFSRATFSWSGEVQGLTTPSGREFLLRFEDELMFRNNSINLVIGPTGSGKTSLLMALLGEMHFIPSGPDSWFSLPREDGIAYAAQESWVLNSTIKENIIFGADFDEQRYKKVIHQCGLDRDLSLFDAGDRTEVGEKGLTLSGGQKARVTLARAIYSEAAIILLDDVLAALDVHTSKWIIDKCFKGDLVKNRTVILVTHNIAMAEPIAQFVVSLKDGRVASQGSLSSALSQDLTLAEEARRDAEALHKADEEVDVDDELIEKPVKKSDGALIMTEEIQEGHVSWASLKLYLIAIGGNHATLFFGAFFGTFIVQQGLSAVQTWYLGFWASQYESHEPSEVNVFYYLGVYGLLLLVTFLLYIASFSVYVFGAIRASREINSRLMKSILGTTLRWLDTTPTSRIIARCTQDIQSIDNAVSMLLLSLLQMTVSMIIKFSAVLVFTPMFLSPGILVAILGAWCSQIYIKAQLSVKREMSNAKAPVLAHFGAAISGTTSIRAYGVQNTFIQESMSRIDKYTRTARTFHNLNRWIDIRIDALAALFSASLAAYLVYFQDTAAFNVGFSLTLAIDVSTMILWWVRTSNDLEVEGNSLERIQAYLTVEQEEQSTKSRDPPASWPTSGHLRVERLSARYSQDGPKVLHELSFTVQSGERIAIVGRTGSGKSSLTLALLRCIYTEGTVYYDGIPISSVNLDALRSRITIIPQAPELLSGTLRQNLDPFDQYDDATLNAALRAAGLFSLQSGMEEGRITLDSTIASGGGNLSVGQRQILALARALVRGSKLLILDEATSAIDYKTDSIIQSSLRNELGPDITLITVAHRLQTIMDADKIMVLDAGRIVEFDSPKNLLSNPKGKLRSLVDESPDKDILYDMAEYREKV